MAQFYPQNPTYYAYSGGLITRSGAISFPTNFFLLSPTRIAAFGGTKTSKNLSSANLLTLFTTFDSNSGIQVASADFLESAWTANGWSTSLEIRKAELEVFINNNFLNAAINPGLYNPQVLFFTGVWNGVAHTIAVMQFGAQGVQRYKNTLTYTGSNIIYNTPAGVTSLIVKCWGAGGGGSAGAGGFTIGEVKATPLQSFIVIVGQGGTAGAANVTRPATFGGGGRGGSGTGFPGGGSGGGLSGLFTTSYAAANALLIAGGGGGGNTYAGGAGGGLNGQNSIYSGPCYSSTGAGGGTQIAGGAPHTAISGTNYNYGTAGTQLQGGRGGDPSGQWGGGGAGGGWYGGGGGSADEGWNSCNYGGSGTGGTGGGGGSGYISNSAVVVGGVTTAGVATAVANSTDVDYSGSYGTPNNHGLVVISYFAL